jgi:hypothetical protein
MRPHRATPLLQGAADVLSGSIHHEAELVTLVRMGQTRGCCKGVLGRHENSLLWGG